MQKTNKQKRNTSWMKLKFYFTRSWLVDTQNKNKNNEKNNQGYISGCKNSYK